MKLDERLVKSWTSFSSDERLYRATKFCAMKLLHVVGNCLTRTECPRCCRCSRWTWRHC